MGILYFYIIIFLSFLCIVSCKKEEFNAIPYDFRNKYIGKYVGVKEDNTGFIDSTYSVEYFKDEPKASLLPNITDGLIIDQNGMKIRIYERNGIAETRDYSGRSSTVFYGDSMKKITSYYYGPQGILHTWEIIRVYKIK